MYSGVLSLETAYKNRNGPNESSFSHSLSTRLSQNELQLEKGGDGERFECVAFTQTTKAIA